LTKFTLSRFKGKSDNVKQIILTCLTSEAHPIKTRDAAPVQENVLKNTNALVLLNESSQETKKARNCLFHEIAGMWMLKDSVTLLDASAAVDAIAHNASAPHR
jgi:hypothetical protein